MSFDRLGGAYSRLIVTKTRFELGGGLVAGCGHWSKEFRQHFHQESLCSMHPVQLGRECESAPSLSEAPTYVVRAAVKVWQKTLADAARTRSNKAT